MQKPKHLLVTIALAASSLVAGACGGGHDRSANTVGGDVATPATSASGAPVAAAPNTLATPAHHSKLAGAAVGAVAGHMLGGHAVAGAAAGALLQHERNKHSR